MDPQKTAFIESLPSDRQDIITTALKPLGVVKWVSTESGCGFAQFGSAAQIKAALEVLPLANLSIKVSDETQTWVSRAAGKATVQNVTRMSPSYLANKIKTNLGKAREVSGSDQGVQKPQKLASGPDGTLDTNDLQLLDEIRQFREQALESKPKNSNTSASFAKRMRTLDNEASSGPRSEDRAQAESKTPSPSEIAPVQAPVSVNPSTPLAASRASSSATKQDLETILPPLVKEYFGEADGDVIRTLRTHIEEGHDTKQLSDEFQEILEDDFLRFASEVSRLQSNCSRD